MRKRYKKRYTSANVANKMQTGTPAGRSDMESQEIRNKSSIPRYDDEKIEATGSYCGL